MQQHRQTLAVLFVLLHFFLTACFYLLNFTIFAESLRIFQEYPQLRCGFFKNICSQFDKIHFQFGYYRIW